MSEKQYLSNSKRLTAGYFNNYSHLYKVEFCLSKWKNNPESSGALQSFLFLSAMESVLFCQPSATMPSPSACLPSRDGLPTCQLCRLLPSPLTIACRLPAAFHTFAVDWDVGRPNTYVTAPHTWHSRTRRAGSRNERRVETFAGTCAALKPWIVLKINAHHHHRKLALARSLTLLSSSKRERRN